MSLLSTLLGRLKSEAAVEYTHIWLPPPGSAATATVAAIQPDKQYLRVWLRSARITEVRRWSTKFHASVHARFELSDRSLGRREVLCVVAPDKTFTELDPKHTDRLITVNEPLLGPVPWRGELSSDIGLFSVAATDLAKPYLDLLAGLTASVGVASLAKAVPWAEPIRRGAEVLFSEAQRSQLEIGLSRTDTQLTPGHWLVARVPKGQLPAGLSLDPNDCGLMDARGRPVTAFPYMVIGIEALDQRDDYPAIADLRAAWDAVRSAVTEARDDDVKQRHAQLRRVIAMSPDLVPTDKKRIGEIFAQELLDAGYALEGWLAPAPRALETARAPARATSTSRPSLRRAEDLLSARAMAVGGTAKRSALEVHTAAALLNAALEKPADKALDKRLSVAELQRLMLDPDVPDHELRRYFMIDRERSRPFAPELAFDPAQVAVQPMAAGLEGAMFMGVANKLARWRRQLKFERRLAAGDTRPVLVSEGDSWFQFPVFLEDVIDHLSGDFNIWSVDAAGDTLANMAHGDGEYLPALRRYSGQARALLFSGAGNDILGDDLQGRPHLLRLLRRFEAGRPAAWYIGNGEFDRSLREVEAGYRSIFEAVALEFPGLPVICHGYDHALPGGYPGDPRNPSWAAQDQWLGAPMRELGITEAALQQDILRLMINRLNQRLRMLCGGNQDGGAYAHAWHVDARGAVQGRWADELHPEDTGYADVAQRFAAVIRQALVLPDAAAAPAGLGALEAVFHADCDAQDELAPAVVTKPLAGKRSRSAKALEAATPAAFAALARPWRLAATLAQLRSTVNAMAPQRSKLSDGTIGDAAHESRASDHNPWVLHQGKGVVTAMDLTHDPQHGLDAGRLAESLRLGRDRRIKYVIFDRRIFSASIQPWQWRPYSGNNPHTQHMHISIGASPDLFDDTAPWQVAV